ncbi:copper homeostasis protein CutC [Francisella noatunensis]|uniref:PF03932 family protein CutC n=1 Tax=Francisella noatunensis TaxID=657445 RepID=A0A9Q2QJ07_9GAMM|nr:copper homeostasis protein CutC [Francisella noatunensis]MBK2028702.1 copper homeostasis protein CutC [Francisella noatunensis]MBK2034409.1 copper homeostasis protein CutC [Francisella noatunensis]MBK2049080.1 copper homeostasis protein CutC [Francisella noatunensis]MBK2049636.1 copper homeostasis protein CutC [Francisella noatunensis]MBK2051908.1 copper homeostasis protein CutC [Francisella noatunensis]
MTTLEICIDNYQSILNAQKASADRLELCSALGVEGLTPSLSLVKFAKDNFTGSLQAMIRHRAGDFYYDEIDQQIMLDDLKTMFGLNVDGIVIGALTKENKIDKKFLEPFIELTKQAGKELTFHRAIDLTTDIYTATQEVIELDFDRILTSGAKPNVIQGLEIIKTLQEKFGSEIQIMPGGGINSTNVKEILKTTKVTNIHCSASKKILRDIYSLAFPASALEIKVSQVDEMNTIKSRINE